MTGKRYMPKTFIVRTYHRFPLHCAVYYYGLDFVGKGTTHNLSRNGWRIDGDHPVKPGMRLALSLLLQGDDVPVKVEHAIVRWQCEGSFGLRIVEMKPSEWARLGRPIANLLEQGQVTHPEEHPISGV
jgi:hypothetical protein